MSFALINPDLTDTGKRRAEIATPGPVPNHPGKPYWVPIEDMVINNSVTLEQITGPLIITIEATRLLRSRTIRDKTPAEIAAEDAARINSLLSRNDINRALAQMIFRLNNRVRALEGDAPLTVAQFKTALRALIR